jgi:hypothetical protein
MKTRRETQQDANWSGAPSPIHRWMEALLRLAAMYLVSLAGLFGMRPSRLVGECHTDATPQALPQSDCEPTSKETKPAAASSRTTAALIILGRTRSVRPSTRPPKLEERRWKDEGVLTEFNDKLVEEHRDSLGLSPLIPAKAGTQGRRQGLSRLKAAAAHRHEDRLDLPRTHTRMSGHIAPL